MLLPPFEKSTVRILRLNQVPRLYQSTRINEMKRIRCNVHFIHAAVSYIMADCLQSGHLLVVHLIWRIPLVLELDQANPTDP